MACGTHCTEGGAALRGTRSRAREAGASTGMRPTASNGRVVAQGGHASVHKAPLSARRSDRPGRSLGTAVRCLTHRCCCCDLPNRTAADTPPATSFGASVVRPTAHTGAGETTADAGHTEGGSEFSLAVRGRNVLIISKTNSGKSWLAGLLCERLILHGYSLLLSS